LKKKKRTKQILFKLKLIYKNYMKVYYFANFI